jgi:inositol hexakisphosphate/diphosphoinositol-pentakisphosphate kinase
MIVS